MYNPREFQVLDSFLEICQKKGKINYIQKNHIMNVFIEKGNVDNLLHDLHLQDDYVKFLQEIQDSQKSQQEQRQQERLNQEKEYQMSVINDEIKKSEDEIKNIEKQIQKLENELQPIESSFINWKNRHERFPHNPNIKKNFDRECDIVDKLKALIMSKHEKITNLTNIIKVWKDELNNL